VRAAAAIAAAGALGLTGCGTEIDSAKGERLIRRAVSEQVGADVRSVRCPKGLEARKGATFRCTVTGRDGSTGQAVVTERDDNGNVGIDAPFLHTGEVERLIAADLKHKVGDAVRVSCPEIVPVRRGGRFTCDGRSGGSRARIAVTQVDLRGHVRYRVKR
jgi:hypothetical protein